MKTRSLDGLGTRRGTGSRRTFVVRDFLVGRRATDGRGMNQWFRRPGQISSVKSGVSWRRLSGSRAILLPLQAIRAMLKASDAPTTRRKLAPMPVPVSWANASRCPASDDAANGFEDVVQGSFESPR